MVKLHRPLVAERVVLRLLDVFLDIAAQNTPYTRKNIKYSIYVWPFERVKVATFADCYTNTRNI